MKFITLFAMLPALLFGEQTFSMVKPEAYPHAKEIIAMYEQNGLKVIQVKEVQMSKQQAQEFYDVHQGRPFYDDLTSYISSGPVVGLILEGDHAVQRVREVMGATNPEKAAPGTIRACFGTNIEKNAVHGSDSVESANKEIQFFFKQIN